MGRHVTTSASTGCPWWSRRDFLNNATAAAAGPYGLSPAFALAAPVPEKFDGSGFKLKAPEPNAKSGGVLRHGMPLRAPHFDIHQAGTIFILGAAACMFDNLIRRDPNDGAKTIIPDLAHSWEIAPDGQTYTFHLRQCVQFHDGAELTSEDVKATYDRIAKPPAGVSIPRSVLFNGTGRTRSECRAADEALRQLLAPLHDPRSAACVGAERAMLAALDGSCRTPIAGLAEADGDRLVVEGLLLKPDGGDEIRAHREGAIADPKAPGTELGRPSGNRAP